MRKSEWILWAMVVAAFVVGALVYPMLPPLIVGHWNAAGEPNGYIVRFWGVYLFPIILALIAALFMIIPRVDPKRENIAKFRKYYDKFTVSFEILMFWIFLLFLFSNLGYRFNIAQAILPPLCAIFAIVGMLLPKTEPNWTIGIRTPWTISSESVWKKTHKIGGDLFKVSALVGLMGLFFPGSEIWFLFFPIIASSIYLVIYSYILYERERRK